MGLQRRQSRGAISKGSLAAIAVLLLVVVGGAWYASEINYFIQLQAWDQGAPKRVVGEFLEAVKQREKDKAVAFIGGSSVKPLERNGRWLGFQKALPMGTQEYLLASLGKPDELGSAKTEFVFQGNGAALVALSDGGGDAGKYRLERVDGAWRIIDLPGGRLGK